MIGGILISLRVVGIRSRLAALLSYGVFAGLVLAVALEPLLHVVRGSLLLAALGLGLSLVATASLVVGLTALLGARGVIVGAIFTILLANPLSGATVPIESISGPWGDLGQYAVPGAITTLIRGLSSFPDASHVTQWVTLCAWTLAGVILFHCRTSPRRGACPAIGKTVARAAPQRPDDPGSLPGGASKEPRRSQTVEV